MPTRVRRLEEGSFDAIVLAAAGVERLQAEQRLGSALDDVAVLRLDPQRFVPAPAQGALAVQCRRDDARVLEALALIDHAPSRAAVTAERDALARAEGGCDVAFGAYCVAGDGAHELIAMHERAGVVRSARVRGADPASARRRGVGQARRGGAVVTHHETSGRAARSAHAQRRRLRRVGRAARALRSDSRSRCRAFADEIIDTPELRAAARGGRAGRPIGSCSRRGAASKRSRRLHRRPDRQCPRSRRRPGRRPKRRARVLGRVDLVGRGGTAEKLALTLLTNRVLEAQSAAAARARRKRRRQARASAEKRRPLHAARPLSHDADSANRGETRNVDTRRG